MTTPVEKKASKFCEFHEEVGHTTDECMHLKRQIEEMPKVGKLSHLIKELKQSSGQDQVKTAKKEETSGKDKPLAILMVQPWQRVARKKITQTFSPKFRPKVINQMIPTTTPLVGFSGEIIWPLGQISLLNYKEPKGKENPGSSIYGPRNAQIPSDKLNGHATKQQDYSTRMHNGFRARGAAARNQPSHRRKNSVAIHPEYSEQTIAIGSTLTEEGRKDLCGLLRCNLDIFAWKPTNMTRVSRHIAEHRLNIREGCLPVRKKKRGQAPKRNNAICEEVEKLLKDVRRFQGLKQSVPQRWLSATKNRLEGRVPLWDEGRNLHGYKVDAEGLRAEMTFKQMKKLIAELPMLTAQKEKEELIMYLAAAKEAISSVLMTKKDGKQMPIYFVSRALQGPKVNYTPIEKLILALILTDFIVERPEDDHLDIPMEDKEELSDPWVLFMNESSCIDGSEAGLIITNPKGMEFTYALRFRFNATNNEAEYEALIAGLRIAEQIGIKNPQANVDSRLVANQVNEVYVAKEPSMIKYLEKVKNLASAFNEFSIKKWIEAKPVAAIREPRPFGIKREQEAIQEAKSKAKMEKYYNVRVRCTSFRLRDLVYQNNVASHAKDGGKLKPKWDGPYEVTKALGKEVYKL
uniref:Reverse transcriptase domain-containing protein n=1 Tax=Tanacetum cinerariifolium TaxID=118510 RepID=A0A6L2L4N7_TANCI|nr:reverse transcriptase domain-containing protein [Tanacetum cinerariifolium]